MPYEAINHAFLPVADLDAAAAAFERLGLRLSARHQSARLGVQSQLICIGGAETLFILELLTPSDAPPANPTPLTPHFARALVAPGALSHIVLCVSDMAATLADLTARGLEATSESVAND